MSGMERAKEIVQEIRAALTAEGVHTVHVTIDALSIRNAVEAGSPCVFVSPPKQDFPNHQLVDYEWALFVVAGPITDQLAAWETIDRITAALKEPLNIDRAEPDAYQQDERGAPYPAYLLTFTETI